MRTNQFTFSPLKQIGVAMSQKQVTSVFQRYGARAVTITLTAYAVVLVAQASQMI